MKVRLHSAGAASRMAALLLAPILPVFSLIAPRPSRTRHGRKGPRCHAGLSSRAAQVRRRGSLLGLEIANGLRLERQVRQQLLELLLISSGIHGVLPQPQLGYLVLERVAL